MTQNWMLDVLADLRAFAEAEGHRALANHLDEALLLAAATLAQGDEPGVIETGASGEGGMPETAPRGTRLI